MRGVVVLEWLCLVYIAWALLADVLGWGPGEARRMVGDARLSFAGYGFVGNCCTGTLSGLARVGALGDDGLFICLRSL